MPLLNEDRFARSLALNAGEVLTGLRLRGDLEGAALGRAGDTAANALIEESIRREYPQDGFLSEESPPNSERLSRRKVWVVDPLDGTREYEAPGNRDDWAVHIALCEDGVPVAGAVALPALGLCYDTGTVASESAGADERMEQPLIRIVVSRTRSVAAIATVAARVRGEIIRMGSAGAKAMAVVRGDADAYIAASPMNEWDSCAPAAVALAAGLHVSHLDGTALTFNKPDPVTRDLLICRPQVKARLLEALASVSLRG